jgi:hypothetical protein
MNESRVLRLLLIGLVTLFLVSTVLMKVRHSVDVSFEMTSTGIVSTPRPNRTVRNDTVSTQSNSFTTTLALNVLNTLSHHDVSTLARERRLHPFEPLSNRPSLADDELNHETQAYVTPSLLTNGNASCGVFSPNSRFLWYRHRDSYCPGQGHAHMDFSCHLTEATATGRIGVIPDALCVPAMHSDELRQNTSVEWHHVYDVNDLVARGTRFVLESYFLKLFDSGCLGAPSNATILTGNEGGPTQVSESTTPVVIRDYRTLVPRVHRTSFELCNLYHKELPTRVAPLPAKRVTFVAQSIMQSLGDNYFSLHVRRTDKVLDIIHWPTLEFDTLPEAILPKLTPFIPAGATLFLITDEPSPREFFVPLEARWRMRYWSDFAALFRDFNLTTYSRYAAEQLVCMWNPARTDSNHKFHFETFPDLTDLPRDGVQA